MESKNRGYQFLRLILVIVIFFFLILVNFTVAITFASTEDYDENYEIHFDNTTDKLIESIEEIYDEDELGIYVPYNESYKTRNYNCWQEYEHENETLTIAQHSVVVRLGTNLRLAASTDMDIKITPSREDMTPLNVYYENGFYVDIPSDGTIGRYTIDGEWDGGTDSVDLFVIYNPWDYSISEEERRAYVYDEYGSRDEKGYIFPTGAMVPQEAELCLYGDDEDQVLAMYEFALEAVSGADNPSDAVVKLNRVVAQRAEAIPAPLSPEEPPHQPHIRDASQILFGEGKTLYFDHEHEFSLDYELYNDYLEEGVVAWELREAFENYDYSIGEEAELKLDTGWWDWRISDNDERELLLKIEGDELRIYDEFGYMDLDYTGLELQDAKILAENYETLDSIQNPRQAEQSKLINAWCDETSIALTALLRSISIPSRIMSAHPRQEHIRDSELMGHFTVEVWLENSLYERTWEKDEGDWYVIDADSWNAEWFVADPVFWSFIGESFSSRSSYGKMGELYFRDNPHYDFKVDNFYVFGLNTERYHLPEGYLFSLEKKEYYEHLKEGPIPDLFIETFEEKNFVLENNYELIEEEGGAYWSIRDEDTPRYLIEPKEDELNIHSFRGIMEFHEKLDVTNHYKDDIIEMEYGSVEKYIGRGGGDLYRLNIPETSVISLKSFGGTEPEIYVDGHDYPALTLTYEGYPPMVPDSNNTGNEIVLPEGEYYIAIYAPKENGRELEGNYGRYTLTLEENKDRTPARPPEPVKEINIEEEDGKIRLNWSSPNDNGAPIQYYKIYRESELRGRVYRDDGLIAEVGSSEYLDVDVLAYGKYSYHIVAVNTMGESESSEESITVGNRIRDEPIVTLVAISLFVLWMVSYRIIKENRVKDTLEN